MELDFLDRYKVFRRIALIWAICLITYVTMAVFSNISLITAAVVSALSLIVGLLATVIAFYMNSRFKEDKRNE